MLDEVYEEAVDIADEKLQQFPGRLTLGMDGHKMGRRHVETVTRAKLGISTFLTFELMGTKRSTGENLAQAALKHLTKDYIAIVADNTSNNTGSQTGLFAVIASKWPQLICLGCCVHVLDLLVEDIAKVAPVTEAGGDAHFLTSFVKKHGLLYEEFLHCQQRLGSKLELVLFPLTRFAYMHLMCQRTFKSFSALRLLSESPVFAVAKLQARQRGQDGAKSLQEFSRFEDLTASRRAREKIGGVSCLLRPFSSVLHYLEGDNVPISHVYPCFQATYDFAQELSNYLEITPLLENEEDRDAVCNAVRERWLGVGRKVGLKDDIHLCAFALDPYVQAVFSSREDPACTLMASDVLVAARRVFKHIAGDDVALRSVLTQQFGLWIAAGPTQSSGGPSSSAGLPATSGNNAYSSLYQTATELVWDRVAKRKQEEESESSSATKDDNFVACVRDVLTDLKQCCSSESPTTFWLMMAREVPSGARASEIEAHRAFCYTARDILAIVGHSAGVERAGKCYKLVMSPLRYSLGPLRLRKLIFIYDNYSLLEIDQQAGSSYESFMTEAEEVVENDPDVTGSGVRRGRLIIEDEPDSNDSESCDDSDSDNNEPVSRIEWRVPADLEVGRKPASIDATCVGRLVYLNWSKYGWQIGKVTAIITADTPRLFKRYNVRITWQDEGHGPCNLDLAFYRHGPSAPVDSWVFLDRLGNAVIV